jgi:glutathione S-transferase
LYESRAILAYLVEKYGKNDSLYPKDPKKRALVNQRLYFDMGTLYYRFEHFFNPQIFEKKPADPEQLKKLEEAVGFFEEFLSKSAYVAGDHATIADYSILAGISTYASLFDFSRFKNIQRWFELCKKLPGIEINNEGLEAMKKLVEQLTAGK